MKGPGDLHSSEIFRSLADVIGVEGAEKLCRTLGGSRIYVPAIIGEHHPIHVAVGKENADRIAEHFHRTVLSLPKGLSRRERVLEYRRTTRMTIREIALATDYTEKTIYQILADDRGGQLDLFNTRIS
ncbi:MAG TPA: hypothetical protein VF463_10650 [Sphingobium sp.]